MKDDNTAAIIVKKQKRPYRLITKSVIARHRAERAIQGNGTRAVDTLEPGYLAPHERAYTIMKKGEEVGVDEYIDERLQQVAVKSIDRLEELVDSTDEAVATRNVHFALEQKRGKAVQKSESKAVILNIEAVLG